MKQYTTITNDDIHSPKGYRKYHNNQIAISVSNLPNAAAAQRKRGATKSKQKPRKWLLELRLQRPMPVKVPARYPEL
ncbi:hypothetical protein ACFX19_029467 [Malus domestica]